MYTNRPKVMQKHFPLRDKPSPYNLATDVGEKHDVAVQHPDVVKRLTKLARDFDRRLQSDKRLESLVGP